MERFLNIFRKVVPAILLVLLLFYVFYSTLFQNEVKAAESYRYTYNGSNIDTNKYPGIKEKIDIIKKNHPNWTFTIMETNLNWNEVIAAEYSGHGGKPKNLIQSKSGSWICPICGDRTYDNGTWKCSSEMTIKYYMDPRNWLTDSANLFQFLQLDYIQSSDDQIYNALANTFLHNMDYAKQINEACRESNVNPYYVVARVIQEQGSGGGSTWKMVDGGTTYYNLFNIGATGNSPSEIYNNALAKAKSCGWTSVKTSIKGGVDTLSAYINARQNTQYLNKFDVEPYDGTYWRQYMQNIEAPKSEASKMYSCMKDAGLLNQSLNFIIPVYTNMPIASSQSPDGVGEIYPKNIRVKPGHSDVILRSSASTSGSIVYTIPDSSVVLLSVERLSNGWHKVVLTDGRYGYLRFDTSYLEEIDDVVNCSETKVINSDGVPMYVGPGAAQTLLTTLSTGQVVTRIDNSGRYTFDGTTWDRIKLADGRQGFVERKYLKDVDSSETFTVRADGGLFLKSKPSMDEADRIRLLSDGTTVTRLGTYTENGAEVMVGGYYWDYVITPDGAKGYVARSYLRDSSGNVPGAFIKTQVNKDDTNKIVEITPATTTEQIKEQLGDNVTITRADGSALDSNVTKTGDIVTINGTKYNLVKIGDAQGDGKINSADLLKIQKHLLKVSIMDQNSAYYKASDANLDNSLNSADLLKIQKYLLGVGNLNIN